MQLLSNSNHPAIADAVVDVALRVSRLVRATTWQQRSQALSDVQLRVLTLVNAYPDCSPSELADYMLLTRPAITRVVDELVERRLVVRRTHDADRRRSRLRVTAAGGRAVAAHLAVARDAVAERLAGLTAAERATVERAAAILRPCFEPPHLGAEAREEAP